jgi:hypothetical protein
MRLGLGNILSGGSPPEVEFTPESISDIALWLKWNTNIYADLNSAGGGITHGSNAGDMANGDQIYAWNAAGDTSINAVQTTNSDKPRWSTESGETGGAKSPSNNKHFDLSSNITLDANTDFTIVMRFRVNDLASARAFLGHTTAEFIRLTDADTIRIKTDGTTSDFDSGTSIEADKNTTVIITRSDGATGNINIFVRSDVSSYFDGTATGTAWGDEVQDNEEIVISNIMASYDNYNEFDGTMKDVIIYDGTAVTSAQREQIFDYLEALES